MTVLFRKSRYLFATYYYKIYMEQRTITVESICVKLFKKERIYELLEYNRYSSAQKKKFEEEVFNPSRKLAAFVYQKQYDKAFSGPLKTLINGREIKTPVLLEELASIDQK
jgi:hypothetical protein